MFILNYITHSSHSNVIPYSWKIWRGIKFGGLAVYLNNRQIKIRQNFLLAYKRTAIPYQTAKLKSANTFAMAIWDPTAKFNSRQYFRLYSNRKIACTCMCHAWTNKNHHCTCIIHSYSQDKVVLPLTLTSPLKRKVKSLL